MADEVDHANDFIERQVSLALGELRQNAIANKGSKICNECGEKIPDARRSLGFRLCIECAYEDERRKSLFSK